jgi:predicted lipid carrier protein YhbT
MSAYAIDVVELPFILLLRPDPLEPKLSAHRRSEHFYWDARISGPFSDLFRIIDGRGDSDAMFFSGSVGVTGDTEAAVCLRNALDDLEGSIVDDLLKLSGPFFLPAQKLLGYWRSVEPTRRQ